MASGNRADFRLPRREEEKRGDALRDDRNGKMRAAAFDRERPDHRINNDRNTQRMNDLYERSSI
jgi:hypothetical protein